ncbi:MAG TPA: alpha/beta hydrolase [Rubrobacteraceae bacterium]|nr:alpha/beta hydrolase [Rubrobacteraceae bacterium]
MGLDPQAEALLREMEAQGLPPFDEMSVPQARDVILAFRDLEGDPEYVADVRDFTVPGPAGELPVRFYRPEVSGHVPLIVYFHGGGWVIGNVEVADKPCRSLANASGCAVASVEYRLAPESKFPAAPEDCYAATRWMAEHAEELGVDAGKIAVAGDSAGGNLAAAVALMARDRGGPDLAYQLLIYPAVEAEADFPSVHENAEGYLLTSGAMKWFWGHYLTGTADAENPYASPLRAEDLSGLPPALVVTCEFDPLRDEGEAYAERLRDAGVEVQATRYDGMIHGFFWMAGVMDQTRPLMEEVGGALRSALLA